MRDINVNETTEGVIARSALRYYSLSNTQPCRNRCTTWSRNLCEAFKWRQPYPLIAIRGHPAHNRTVGRESPVSFPRRDGSLSHSLSLPRFIILPRRTSRSTRNHQRNGAAFASRSRAWRRRRRTSRGESVRSVRSGRSGPSALWTWPCSFAFAHARGSCWLPRRSILPPIRASPQGRRRNNDNDGRMFSWWRSADQRLYWLAFGRTRKRRRLTADAVNGDGPTGRLLPCHNRLPQLRRASSADRGHKELQPLAIASTRSAGTHGYTPSCPRDHRALSPASQTPSPREFLRRKFHRRSLPTISYAARKPMRERRWFLNALRRERLAPIEFNWCRES